MKKLLCAGAMALMSWGFAPIANAGLVQWTLTNVQFEDGGTASGSYVFDASTNTFSRISVSTTGSEAAPAANFSNTCDGSTCVAVSPNPAQILIFSPADTSDMTGKQVLLLDLQSPMTDAGGTIAINPVAQPTIALQSKAFSTICADASCSNPGNMRLISSGEVVGQVFVAPAASATPVPAMAPWGLALLSLLVAPLAWLHKRRQR